MSLEEKKAVNFLIVDSSVLIRRAPLKDLAEKVYAVEAVVSEIKDIKTRESLQVLPYEFNFKEPTSDSIRFVSQFAKKTGDFHNLSVVDLHLIALTYQICKENMNAEEFAQLKAEPPTENQPLINANNIKLDKSVNVAGFYIPPRKQKPQTNKDSTAESNLVENFENIKLNTEKNDVNNNDNVGIIFKSNTDNTENLVEEDEDEDDGEGWITPGNFDIVKQMSSVQGDEECIDDMQITVGCMTSDFSMQNVLVLIGIPVLSVDGLLIKKPRSYVKKCITCSKITTNMSKEFCQHCGYKSLERVVVSIDENGNKIYRGRRKTPSAKSMIFSLPMPHGGKHSTYPILSEDQPRAQQLPSKRSREKNDPLDPDYATFNSPFVTKDVYSRAARLGIRTDNSRFNKRV